MFAPRGGLCAGRALAVGVVLTCVWQVGANTTGELDQTWMVRKACELEMAEAALVVGALLRKIKEGLVEDEQNWAGRKAYRECSRVMRMGDAVQQMLMDGLEQKVKCAD